MPRFLWLVSGVLSLLPLTCGLKADGADDPAELLHYTEKDLPTEEKDPAGVSEIEEFASARGFRYGRDSRRAARGGWRGGGKHQRRADDGVSHSGRRKVRSVSRGAASALPHDGARLDSGAR